MSEDDTPARDPRVRRTWIIAGVGTLTAGVGLAALVGASGGSGQGGAVAFLVGTSLACAVAALYAVGTAVVDQVRHRRHVALSRVVSGGVLFVLAALLLAMSQGAATA